MTARLRDYAGCSTTSLSVRAIFPSRASTDSAISPACGDDMSASRQVSATVIRDPSVVVEKTKGTSGPVGDTRQYSSTGSGWYRAAQVSFMLTLESPPEVGISLR